MIYSPRDVFQISEKPCDGLFFCVFYELFVIAWNISSVFVDGICDSNDILARYKLRAQAVISADDIPVLAYFYYPVQYKSAVCPLEENDIVLLQFAVYGDEMHCVFILVEQRHHGNALYRMHERALFAQKPLC